MSMQSGGNGPFHTITARDVWDKLDGLEKAVTRSITKMESHEGMVKDNAERIKSLELKLYGIAAGLIAAVTMMVAGFFR